MIQFCYQKLQVQGEDTLLLPAVESDINASFVRFTNFLIRLAMLINTMLGVSSNYQD